MRIKHAFLCFLLLLSYAGSLSAQEDAEAALDFIELSDVGGPFRILASDTDDAGNMYVALKFMKAFKVAGNNYEDWSKESDQRPGFDRSGDGMVLKLSPEGDLLWSTAIQQKGDLHFDGFQVDPEGRSYLLFYFGGELRFNFDEYDAFDDKWERGRVLMRLDTEGKVDWEQRMTIGGSLNNRPSLAVGKDAIYLAVHFSEEFIVGEEKLTQELRALETLLVRFDKEGAFSWMKVLDTQAEPKDERSISVFQPQELAIDNNGDLYLTVMYGGNHKIAGNSLLDTTQNMDNALIKLNAEGKPLWARYLYNAMHTELSVHSDGTAFVAGGMTHKENGATMRLGPDGKTSLKTDFTGAGYAAAFSTEGNPLWLINPIEEVGVSLRDVGVDAKGSVYLTGDVSQNGLPQNILGVELEEPGMHWALRLDAEGNPQNFELYDENFESQYGALSTGFKPFLLSTIDDSAFVLGEYVDKKDDGTKTHSLRIYKME